MGVGVCAPLCGLSLGTWGRPTSVALSSRRLWGKAVSTLPEGLASAFPEEQCQAEWGPLGCQGRRL